jgi:sulfopyruvate decarboxylase subunit alpha
MSTSAPLKGSSLIRALKESRVEFLVALPDIVTCDSVLWPATNDPDFKLVPVCKEDEGVSICGALSYCARRAALLIQHTGFLDSINAIRNNAVEYQLPVVMIIGLQGMEPDCLPSQSKKLGIRIVEPICTALGLQYRVLTDDSDVAMLKECIDWAYENSAPIALFVATTPVTDA